MAQQVWQRTVRQKTVFCGIGVHSGKPARVEILPAPADHGLIFVRSDVAPHLDIPAQAAFVSSTQLATTLSNLDPKNGQAVSISTVEHLVAACAGLGLDNARIWVDGPEVPILDGSSAPFAEGLLAAGLEDQPALRRYLRIRREVMVSDDAKKARLRPWRGAGFWLRGQIDFDHPLIASEPLDFIHGEDDFLRELAPARTFGFLKDTEALQAKGLALGGSVDNAIIIDDLQILNPDGLRYADEFVRHKMLDALGDLALLGRPLLGQLDACRSGHTLNFALVQALLADPRAAEEVVFAPQGSKSSSENAAAAWENAVATAGFAPSGSQWISVS